MIGKLEYVDNTEIWWLYVFICDWCLLYDVKVVYKLEPFGGTKLKQDEDGLLILNMEEIVNLKSICVYE